MLTKTSDTKKPYEKGKYLIPGLEGTTYQVIQLMKYALKAYKDGTEFELLTEAEEFEKFDDIVIHRGEITKVIQVKHAHNENAEYKIEDFLKDPLGDAQGKKVGIAKYFDAWYKIRLRESTKRITFKLVSSYKFDDSEFKKEEHKTALKSSIKANAIFYKTYQLLEKVRFRLNTDVVKKTYENLYKATIANSAFVLEGNGKKKQDIHLYKLLLINFLVYSDSNPNQASLACSIKKGISYIESDKDIDQKIKFTIVQENSLRTLIKTTLNSIRVNHKNDCYDFLENDDLSLLFAGCLECCEDGLFKFTKQFLSGEKRTSLQTFLFNKLTDSKSECKIIDDSIFVNSDPDFENQIEAFFSEFKLVTGQMRVQELDDWVEKQIFIHLKSVFPESYEAFYLNFLRWLRDSSYCQTKATIEAFIKSLDLRLDWHDLAGITKHYLESKLKDYPVLYQESQELKNIFNLEKSLMIISGPSSKANSILIRDLINSNMLGLNRGEYIFIPEKVILAYQNIDYYLRIFSSKGLRFIIIDNVNELLNASNMIFFKKLLEKAKECGKKIIVTIKEKTTSLENLLKNSDIQSDEHSVPLLNQSQIKIVLEYKKALSFNVSKKSLYFGEILENPESIIYKFIQNLDNLLEIIKNPTSEESIINNNPEEQSIEKFPYITPNINKLLPGYLLDSLLQSVEFQFSVIQIKITNISQTEKIKNNLGLKKKVKYKKIEYKPELDENDFQANDNTFILLDLSSTPPESYTTHLSQILRDPKKLILITSHEGKFLDIPSDFKISVYENATKLLYLVDTSSKPLELDIDQNIKEPFEHEALIKKTFISNQTLITSKAGLGKSRLCIETEKLWASKKFDSSEFLFVFTFTLSKVSNSNLGDTPIDTVYKIIKKLFYQSSSKTWELNLLEIALRSREVLIICDGLDELLPSQYQRLKNALESLFNYSDIITTSRPGITFQFKPKSTVSLDNFDDVKIRDFITQYLKKNTFTYQNLNLFVDSVLLNSHLKTILSNPLHCYLFCKLLPKSELSATKLAEITRLTLYQKLILGEFKRFLINRLNILEDKLNDDKTVYSMIDKWLKRILKVAFTQIGLAPRKYPKKSFLDQDIQQIGFVQLGEENSENYFILPHKTFIEYCAALHIAIGLSSKNNKEKFHALVKKYRYDARFLVVWELLARILIDGDPVVQNNLRGADVFCRALLENPRDLIGEKHSSLIQACFTSENYLKIPYQQWYFLKILEKTPQPTPVKNKISRAEEYSKPKNSERKFWNLNSAISQFTSKKDFDLRYPYTDFTDAYEFLITLKDQKTVDKITAEFIDNTFKEYLEETKQKKLTLKGTPSSHWKNTFCLCVKIIVYFSKIFNLSEKNELFILKSILLVSLEKNSQWLDSELRKSLSHFYLRSLRSGEYLKNVLKERYTDSCLTNLVDCMEFSGLSDRELSNILKDKLNTHFNSNTKLLSLEALIKLKYSDQNFIKNQLLILIEDNSIQYTIIFLCKSFIDIFENRHEISKLLESFYLILKTSVQKYDHSSIEKIKNIIEIIDSLLARKKINILEIKEKIIDCFEKNKRSREFLIRLFIQHDTINRELVDTLLTFTEGASFTCKALLQLPDGFIDKKVSSFIIEYVGKHHLWGSLKSLLTNKKCHDIFSDEQIKKIKYRAASESFLNNSSSVDAFNLLCLIIETEDAEELYVKTIPSEPNTRPKTKITTSLSETSIKIAWESFLQRLSKDNTTFNFKAWHMAIITSYITNKDLAVTIEKNKFIIYGPDAPIVLKIPNTLENLDAFTKNLRDFFIKKRSSDYAKLEFDLTKTLIKEQLTNSDNRAGKPANFFQPATTQLLAVSPSKKSRPRSTQYIRPQNF